MKCALVFCFCLFGYALGKIVDSNAVIREDERRGSNIDSLENETKQRSLFSISGLGGLGGLGGGGKYQHHPSYPPSGYESSSGPGGYGFSGTGHGFDGQRYGGHYPQPPSGHGGGYEGEYGHSGPGGHGGGGHGSIGHSGGGGGYGILHGGGDHSLYLKKLLIPLAGIAILGAAAALSTNPVLLQLGVVNGKRRRRRHIRDNYVYPSPPNIRPNI